MERFLFDLDGTLMNADFELENQFLRELFPSKEEADLINEASQMIFQTNKALEDLKDSISEDEKNDAKAKADALQEALDKHDLEEVKAKKADLEKTVQALATKVYQQAQQAQQSAQNENPSNGKHDDAVDADYTEN